MAMTDELRRMLDERGIVYETACVPHTFHRTEWEAGSSRYEFLEDRYPHATELRVTTRHATPAQAIAATVDAGTCHMVLRDDIRNHAYQDTYECDVCGEQIERGTVMGKSEPPRFCCGCGRRVIERGGA